MSKKKDAVYECVVPCTYPVVAGYNEHGPFKKHRCFKRGYKLEVEQGEEVPKWFKPLNAVAHSDRGVPYKPEELPSDTVSKEAFDELKEQLAALTAQLTEKKEDTTDEPSGPPSVETICKVFTEDQMVEMLKADGLSMASTKWAEEKLAGNVIKRGLYEGKL
jgi:hypothetical protein